MRVQIERRDTGDIIYDGTINRSLRLPRRFVRVCDAALDEQAENLSISVYGDDGRTYHSCGYDAGVITI